MKRFLGCLSALAIIAFTCCVMPIPKAKAQYLGTAAQQTTTQSFNVTLTGASFIPIVNLGQEGHEIIYSWASQGACIITLQGSTDASTWANLAVGASRPTGGSVVTFYANGWYPHLQLAINGNADAACVGDVVTGSYIGFQLPLPVTGTGEPFPISVAAATSVYTQDPAPFTVNGLHCFNPNAAIAYVQAYDSATAPTLGTGYVFETGIPAGGALSMNSPFAGVNHLYLAAVTAAGGNTAVGTALDCTAIVNRRGPFYPYQTF